MVDSVYCLRSCYVNNRHNYAWQMTVWLCLYIGYLYTMWNIPIVGLEVFL